MPPGPRPADRARGDGAQHPDRVGSPNPRQEALKATAERQLQARPAGVNRSGPIDVTAASDDSPGRYLSRQRGTQGPMSEGLAPTNHGVDSVGTTRYDAFISYSHVSDGALAKALQQGLRRLAHPGTGTRALRVFRVATRVGGEPEPVDLHLRSARLGPVLRPHELARVGGVRVGRSRRSPVGGKRNRRTTSSSCSPWARSNGSTASMTSTGSDRRRSTPALRGAFQDEPLYLDLRWARALTSISRCGTGHSAKPWLSSPLPSTDARLEDLLGDDVRERRILQRTTGVGVLGLVVAARRRGLRHLVRVGSTEPGRQAATKAEARSLSPTHSTRYRPGYRVGHAPRPRRRPPRPGPSTRPPCSGTLKQARPLPGTPHDVGRGRLSRLQSQRPSACVVDGGAIEVWDLTRDDRSASGSDQGQRSASAGCPSATATAWCSSTSTATPPGPSRRG